MEGDKEIKFSLRARKYSYAIRNRVIYPGAVYHLIQRAPGEEIIFKEEADYLHMLSLLKETATKFRWDVFSFVLMPNHVHFLIRILEETLSPGAKFLFQSYALYFNEKYERKGPVFCRPFRAFLCLNDAYLLTISIYIHLNPYKAKLVEDPFNYRWSSIRLFLPGRTGRSFIKSEILLKFLSAELKRAREIYRELLEASLNLDFPDINSSPNLMSQFHFDFLKLCQDFKEKVIPSGFGEKIQAFNLLKYKKGVNMERKDIIKNLLHQGYNVRQLSQYFNCSRQQIYRLLNS